MKQYDICPTISYVDNRDREYNKDREYDKDREWQFYSMERLVFARIYCDSDRIDKPLQ